MGTFYVLRGGRVVYPPGHYDKDQADRKALATLRRHPKSICTIVEAVSAHTLQSAEYAAQLRRERRAAERAAHSSHDRGKQ